MKIEWNNCFLCLNDLTGQVKDSEDLGRRSKKRKKKGKVDSVSKNCLGQAVLLLNYLLSSKSDRHSGLISDIKQLLEGEGDEGTPVKFCDNCEGQLRKVSELHRELEVVQMKLVSVLKLVKTTVVENSRKGGGDGNVGLEIFEQWLREQESNFAGEENEEEKQKLKEQRKILEALVAFQDAVLESEKSTVDIPRVLLDQHTHFRPKPSEPLQPSSEVIVKTEFPDLDDIINPPLTPDHQEFDFPTCSDPPSKNDQPPRKRKKKSAPPDMDIKREALRPPRASTSTARLKMIEINNSYTKKKKELPPNKPPPRKIYPVPPLFHRKPHSKLQQRFKRHFHLLYCCASCPFTVRSLYSLEEHLHNHETETASKEDPQSPPFQCDQCPLKFHLEQSAEFHKLTHNGHYVILCETCNSWQDPKTFKDHMKSHLEKIFPCPNCSYCGTTRDKYLSHLFDHHFTSSILECDICALRSSGKQKFLDHYFEVHQAIEKLICGVDGCTKEFLDPLVLKQHKNIHTEKFKCAYCEKVLACQAGLETHMMLHTGDKRWTCDQCEDAYTTKVGLQKHKIRSHGAPKVTCEYCGKGFADRTSLKIHQVAHTGVGYRCEVEGCGKAFGNKTLLRRHAASHANEKTVVCDECGKGFSYEAHLKRHKLIHEGEAAKKWKCQYCGKAFLFEKYLIPHVRIHTGEKPFVCDACGKDFNQYAALFLHKRKCHVGTSAPPPRNPDERTEEMKGEMSFV